MNATVIVFKRDLIAKQEKNYSGGHHDEGAGHTTVNAIAVVPGAAVHVTSDTRLPADGNT